MNLEFFKILYKIKKIIYYYKIQNNKKFNNYK